jgi:glutamate-1-semialdehyde 2,1-aminomutase
VYFPPSQFETGFISTAHTDEDIARTVGVVTQALRHAA